MKVKLPQIINLASAVFGTTIFAGYFLLIAETAARAKTSHGALEEISQWKKPTYKDINLQAQLPTFLKDVEGVWEAILPSNNWQMRVVWNPQLNKFQGFLIKQGELSATSGFSINELVWEATPVGNSGTMAERQKWRSVEDGVSFAHWREGTASFNPANPNILTTAASPFERVGIGKNRVPQQDNADSSPTEKHPDDGEIPSTLKLSTAGQAPDRNGLTSAGRAFQKHGSRNPGIWGKPEGTFQNMNKKGQQILDQIINSSTTKWTTPTRLRYGGKVVEGRLPDGRGGRWSGDGSIFHGFLEP